MGRKIIKEFKYYLKKLIRKISSFYGIVGIIISVILYAKFINTSGIITPFIPNFIDILITVIIIYGILELRDNERWVAINDFTIGLIYMRMYPLLSELFSMLNVECSIDEPPTIKKFGIEYFNSEYDYEHHKRLLKELKKIIKESEELKIKNCMEKWDYDDFKKFGKILENFYSDIDRILREDTYNIPARILKYMIRVKRDSKGISNFMQTITHDKETFIKLKKGNSILQTEAKQTIRLLKNIYKLIKILKPQQNFFKE